MPPNNASVTPLPWVYSLFFLYVEPVSTIVGAYFAHFQQSYYMHQTYSTTTGLLSVSTRESIVLSQLANFNRRVWSTILLVLLIADFGHLYSVKAAGLDVYYRFWEWNAMYWGNLGFVYVGATLRTCFLLGIGLPGPPPINAKLSR